MSLTFDRIDWGSTRIDATVGDWTRSVADIDLGMVEYQQYITGSPWVGGDQVIGSPRPMGRRFAFYVDSVFDGTATDEDGAHMDEIENLTELFSPGTTTAVALKTTRNNTSGSAVTRQINAYCTMAYPMAFTRDRGTSGIWVKHGSGRIRYKVECYAPWPLWEDTSESSQAITAATAVSNSGSMPTGCKIILTSKSGTVTSVVMSNGSNSYTTTFTNPADNDVANWNYSDRTGASMTGTISSTSYFRLETGSNSLTKTVNGGGTMTATVYWRNEWFTP